MTTTSQTTRSAHTQIDRETILPFLLRIALSDQLTLAHVIAVSSMNGIFGEETRAKINQPLIWRGSG